MARTLDKLLASRPTVDMARIEATSEDDIARQAEEDGSCPAAELTEFVERRPGDDEPTRKSARVSMTIEVDPDVLQAWRASGAVWKDRARALMTNEARRLKKA